VIAAAVVITLLVAVLTPFILSKTVTWPHSYYLQTADWKFGTPESPWAYRLVKPVLAGLLPGDNRYSFIVLTYLALILAQIGLYALFVEFSLPPGLAFTGMVLFAFSYPFRKAMMYPWMLDDWNQMFIIWGLLLIAREKWRYFAVWLALGCANHEHVLFLVPVLIVSQWRSIRKNHTLRPILTLIPAAAVFFIIRQVIQIPNREFFSYYLSLANIASCYELQGGIRNIINLVYNTFSIFWLLTAFGLWKLKLSKIEQSAIILIPLSFVQLIVGCDTSRLVAVNAALIFMISLQLLRKLHWGWTVFAAGTFILRSIARFGGISLFHPRWLLMLPTQVFTFVELIGFLVLFWMYRKEIRT